MTWPESVLHTQVDVDPVGAEHSVSFWATARDTRHNSAKNVGRIDTRDSRSILTAGRNSLSFNT